MAHASPSSKPVSCSPATSAAGSRRSSYQARLVAATSAPGASAPVRLSASQASSVARSRRSRPGAIGRASVGVGRGIRVGRPRHVRGRDRRSSAGLPRRRRHPDERPLGARPGPRRRSRAASPVDAGRLGDRREERREPPLQLVELRVGRGAVDDRDRRGRRRRPPAAARGPARAGPRAGPRRATGPRPRRAAPRAAPTARRRRRRPRGTPRRRASRRRRARRRARAPRSRDRSGGTPARSAHRGRRRTRAGSLGRPSPSASDRRTRRLRAVRRLARRRRPTRGSARCVDANRVWYRTSERCRPEPFE